MMNKRNWALGAVMLSLLATGFGIAGEIRVRAVSLSPGYPAGDVFVQDAEGKEKGVKIGVKSFLNHEFQKLDFDGSSLVFTADGNPDSAKDAEKLLGRVEVPAQLKSAILFFRPGIKDEPASVELVADAAAVFPAGSTKVVNLVPESIRIELEGENFDCKGENELVIKDPPVKKNNSSGMRAFRQKEGKWVQVKAGNWPHPGTKRVVQLIVLNPLTKRVEFYGVKDISDPNN